MIWAQLVHLGTRMWADRDGTWDELEFIKAKDTMQFDKSCWDSIMQRFVDEGINTVVIDLGEGVKYRSHPELAAPDAWTTEELKAELAKLRGMGLTPIPKMNFSAAHDEWMGEYARMLSTDVYYGVCEELIAEAIELFDGPPLFHLGMDEETWQHQQRYSHSIIRQGDLWWHDLMFYVEQVEKGGARAWVWSDYVWHHPELFYERMPKSVLQSNWYYGRKFAPGVEHCQAYLDLEAHGYDQVPAGSNWDDPDNLRKTVAFCKEHVAPERLKGFLQTVWKPTVDRRLERHVEAAREVGRGKRVFEEG